MDSNSNKTHPKFPRRYRTGHMGYCLHAEMSVIRFARPGDELIVIRWEKDGRRSMSKPCEHCQRFLRRAGVSKVTYSDWNGDFKTMNFKG
jgi:deoxycytidylate deaminase